jgi:hypothetical protein
MIRKVPEKADNFVNSGREQLFPIARYRAGFRLFRDHGKFFRCLASSPTRHFAARAAERFRRSLVLCQRENFAWIAADQFDPTSGREVFLGLRSSV